MMNKDGFPSFIEHKTHAAGATTLPLYSGIMQRQQSSLINSKSAVRIRLPQPRGKAASAHKSRKYNSGTLTKVNAKAGVPCRRNKERTAETFEARGLLLAVSLRGKTLQAEKSQNRAEKAFEAEAFNTSRGEMCV